MDDPKPPQSDTCESCGDSATLTLVRRVYLPLDPERPPTDDDEVDSGELEWWCEVCRVHYPHQLG